MQSNRMKLIYEDITGRFDDTSFLSAIFRMNSVVQQIQLTLEYFDKLRLYIKYSLRCSIEMIRWLVFYFVPHWTGIFFEFTSMYSVGLHNRICTSHTYFFPVLFRKYEIHRGIVANIHWWILAENVRNFEYTMKYVHVLQLTMYYILLRMCLHLLRLILLYTKCTSYMYFIM